MTKETTLIEVLERIADALEAQNKLLNDVLCHPSDLQRPPRVLVEPLE